MKKKSKYLLMFVGAFITMICGIQNVFASTLNMEFTGYYYERSDNGNNYASWKLQNYVIDGHVAYCIEPGIPEGTDQYIQGSWEDTGLSNSIKERVLLLSYYGYQYDGHQTQKFRAATQAMIWETILGGNTRVTYSTARYGQGTPYDVSYERSVIENLVAHHYTRPSFNGSSVTTQVGTPITITDTNNVLSNYEVYASNGAEVKIDGNKLTITPTQIGNINIQFVKKQIYNRSYLIYYADGWQNMLSGGNVDPVVSNIKVNSLGGKVDFYKYDIDTNTNKPTIGSQAKLNGAVYGVYDATTDALIQKLTTNNDGYAISDNLPSFGRYYLKELVASEGYTLDTTKYYFSSNIGSINATLRVKEKVITRNFEFTKVYATDKTGIMTPEVGIEFGIYDHNGNLFTKKITNNEGKIYVTLPYGSFTLKQLTSTKDHELMEDYKFEARELGETNKVFANAPIDAKLKVVKIDKETDFTIPMKGITFKIKNKTTNEYICQTITYPNVEKVCEFKTDSNGILYTPFELMHGTYILEEVDQKIDGYLWNNKGTEFVIGEDSNFIVDPELGTILEVKFSNIQVKGQIVINKQGEDIKIDNGTYSYIKINLKGATFEVRANEDISINGFNYYKKGDLVATLITDSNGYANIDNLPLGKYTIQEKLSSNGNMLDDTIYEVNLTYKDQYTEVITITKDLENYLPKGNVEFTKIDLTTGIGIKDTKIEIYTEDDKLIYTGITDYNGKITIENLFTGKFYILETEASTGYKLSNEKVYFEILENGEIVKANMTNEKIKGTLDFTKVDISNDKPLPNTTIEIYTEDDKLIYTGVTDDNGKIIIENIEYGKYYILEKNAPDGYSINTEKMYFEILEDGEVVKAVMKDEAVKVPNTGLSNINWEQVSYITLIITGIGFIIYGIKKKKK